MDWTLTRASLGGIVGRLGFCLLLLGGAFPAHAAPSLEFKPLATDSGKRFATVWRVRGDVTASTRDGANSRKLSEGDAVFVGERLRAAQQAEAVLKTEDAGAIAIRPSTEFVAERFAAEDKPTDSFTMRLLTGSLRVISGWIARTNRSGHTIVTASATIGIRGTDHEPYVLSAELARATNNPAGTYDKVNRGGTTMEVGENKLDIDPGKVGFVRASSGVRERALMTILLPVLLDKVPSFYVPGEFDAELDRYSATADQDSLQQLELKRKAPAAPKAAACVPTTIAKTWLKQLDGAIARNDAPTIIAMFADDAAVRATVRDKDGKMTSIDLGREELVQSTLAAMKSLKGYKQRRVWTEGKSADLSPGAGCDRINLRSVVVEQGRLADKPYRFESLEEYLLEKRAGKWLAIKAETTQQ
ncbi:MAG: hypothetical protein K9K30_06000 [Burkholderiaceae bacterium]|nr:hypothetical protein [Sulfuritalea sp.]MCF8174778.1 hypothetical protein [Burkholderiaceae bacterium]